MAVDPLSEIYAGMSAYNYVGNNPINSIDPNGMSISGVNQPSGSMPDGFSFRDGGIDYYYGTSAQQAFRSWQSEYSSYEESGKARLSKYTTNTFNSGLTDDCKCGCDGKPPCPEVPLMKSIIPIWGSYQMAKNDFQNGKYGWALFNSGMAISDVFLVKSLIVGGGKIVVGTFWKTGSHSWSATRGWLGRTGQAKKGQQVHHWLIHRNGPIGKNIDDAIKNQPWNLKNMPKDPRIHQAIHGKGPWKNRQIPYLLWYGTPGYVKGGVAYPARIYEYNYRE